MILLVVLGLVACSVPADRVSSTPEAGTSQPADAEVVAAPLPISGLATVFADELTQWDVFDYDGERAGELKLRFPPVAGQGGDFTQWTFRFDQINGSIRPKIRGRSDLWEVRVGDDVSTVRTLFPGQYDQWNILTGTTRYVYTVRDYALLEYWSVRGPGGPGRFEVYTRIEGDPRDWEVYDELTAPIGPAAQLAMIWLPVYMRLVAGS